MHRHCVHSFKDIGSCLPRTHLCANTSHATRQKSSFTARQPRPITADRDHDFVERLTANVIENASRANVNELKGWTVTKSLRGNEKRLTALIPTTDKPKPPSVQKTRFEASSEFIDDLDEAPDSTIEAGAFIEIRRNEVWTHGVALAEEYFDRRWFIVSLTSSGEIWKHIKEDIVFTIPGLADKNLASRCGADETAQTQTQIMARAEVLKRIRVMERNVENYCNTIGKNIHNVYPQVKSPNPNEWSSVSVPEAARLILPTSSPSPIALFAVHKLLLGLNKEFVADDLSYRTTQSLAVRPQSHIDKINAVTDMSRLQDGPLDAFSQRARIVSAANRQRALESSGEPPSESRTDSIIFTSEDALILEFLLNSLRRVRKTQPDPYALGRAAIIKRLESYPGVVDDSVVHSTLVELGVIPPWQDIASRARQLGFYQGSDETSPKVMEQNAIITKAFSSNPTPQKAMAPLGPEDFYPFDLVESIRHDFGDMPVYVIDDAKAEELDDGISIETIPSEPGSCWVHVHIADPTAVIPPTHVFARQARTMTQTAYFVHRTWPMLPKSLMRDKLSLGSASAKGEPERVVTFSFRVDHEGNIPDYKVRAGFIRNIHFLNYDGLDLAMGHGCLQLSYPFGGKPPPSHAIQIDQYHMNNLRALKGASDRLFASRLKLPTYNTTSMNCTISMSSKPGFPTTTDMINPVLYRGFPHLKYEVSSIAAWDWGSRRIVSELMKGACRVASRFCLDHCLPTLRRASSGIQVQSEADNAKLLSLRDSNGYVEYIETLRHDVVFRPVEYTLEPKMHWGLGVPEGEGYVRVTSPLRRYSDMVTHWQIKHALLPSSPSPPFSADSLMDYSRTLTQTERYLHRTQKVHDKFWSLLYIDRWLKDPRRADGWPNPFDDLVAHTTSLPGINMRTRDFQTMVKIPALGLDAILAGLSVLDEMPVGYEVPVKIGTVRLGVNPMLTVLKR